MTPLQKHRAGHPVTSLDQIEACACECELDGFVDQRARDRRELTRSEIEAIARRRVELKRRAA
jgi:hypothetical protein